MEIFEAELIESDLKGKKEKYQFRWILSDFQKRLLSQRLAAEKHVIVVMSKIDLEQRLIVKKSEKQVLKLN